ncbi:DUF4416 family protein [Parasphaerochaeta coccoides]|uniref:GTP-binding protein n=1 Tax=Parasphaerochaeta coccoides (strain ATCC BAA-1237 / DSM 17374 / SPN1) TaxID=760011 RepID=F4GLX9_PARC1|nr:DUF4416 family protein [Parasphaerochaeta coccoides]AEC03020.1 GTP-binding protein [Parasphaerochaeta coccoides DSM 17374]
MAEVQLFVPVRLFMGVLSCDDAAADAAMSVLSGEYGSLRACSTPVPFSQTDYYDHEMGTRPKRSFCVFETLVDPSSLARIKHLTNGLEKRFLNENGGRMVNLDPGLLSGGSLILATTKNRSHRIALSDGIYGEVTLIYFKGGFQAFPWTYADYGSQENRALFSSWRTDYLKDLDVLKRTEKS